MHGQSARCAVQAPHRSLRAHPDHGHGDIRWTNRLCRLHGEDGGDQVTGVGSVDIEYTRTGTCAAHLGEGAVSWKIPTEHGDKKLVGSLYVTRIGVSVAAKLEFPHARADLTGALYRLEGDCLLTPLSRVSVLVTGVLAGA